GGFFFADGTSSEKSPDSFPLANRLLSQRPIPLDRASLPSWADPKEGGSFYEPCKSTSPIIPSHRAAPGEAARHSARWRSIRDPSRASAYRRGRSRPLLALALDGLDGVSLAELEEAIAKTVLPGMSPVQRRWAQVYAARSLIFKEPNYSYVA